MAARNVRIVWRAGSSCHASNRELRRTNKLTAVTLSPPSLYILTAPTNSVQCAPPVRAHSLHLETLVDIRRARFAARMIAVATVVGAADSAARFALLYMSIDKLTPCGG